MFWFGFFLRSVVQRNKPSHYKKDTIGSLCRSGRTTRYFESKQDFYVCFVFYRMRIARPNTECPYFPLHTDEYAAPSKPQKYKKLAWIKTTKKNCTSKSSHLRWTQSVDVVGTLENGDVGERRGGEKKIKLYNWMAHERCKAKSSFFHYIFSMKWKERSSAKEMLCVCTVLLIWLEFSFRNLFPLPKP